MRDGEVELVLLVLLLRLKKLGRRFWTGKSAKQLFDISLKCSMFNVPVRFSLVWFSLVWFGLAWFGLVKLGLVQNIY